VSFHYGTPGGVCQKSFPPAPPREYFQRQSKGGAMIPGPAMKTEITGRGRPLVLVPGRLTRWLSWKPHAARLATAFTVVRVQLLTVDHGLRPDLQVHRACGHALHVVGMERLMEAFGAFLGAVPAPR
jgi:hypothetical protein